MSEQIEVQNIQVGDLVILNGDAPCRQRIALVTSRDGVGPCCQVRYIARRLLSYAQREFKKPFAGWESSMTKVSTFGVDVIGLRKNDEGEWFLDVQQNRESEATYEDGLPRKWENGSYACVLSDEMVGILLRTRGETFIPLNTPQEVKHESD